MISLTRLNHIPIVVNSDLIEHIEATPDTVVALTTGQKILVLESADEIIDRVVRFRRRLACGNVLELAHVSTAGTGRQTTRGDDEAR